jgi:tetratricopeptide (TPR) repeat protein
VLLWYQETATDLLRIRSLAEASVHLPRGRRIFPSDPLLLFFSGILHERFSSSSLQAAAASVVAGNRAETSLGSERAELTRAERFFRDTLAVQPDHLEARVRYGHVLAALGRHDQAAEALRTAIKSGVTGEWLYLAEMFLGVEEEILGQRARARARFEHAASLYPRAQSPRIALSQLSRRAGDRAGAQRELRILAEIPANRREREDPWWDYYDIR